MFRALYAHHQEVELYWCSIWYCHWLRATIPDAASMQFNLLMMSIWCSKHVEDYNKRIKKKASVYQIGHCL